MDAQLTYGLANKLASVLGPEAVYRPAPCPDGHPNQGGAIGEPCGANLATPDDPVASFADETCEQRVGREPADFLDPRVGLDLYEAWARISGAVLIDVRVHAAGCTLNLLTPHLTHPVAGEGWNLVTAIWVAVERALSEER